VSAITGIFDKFLTKKACNDSQTPTMKSIKFSEYVKNIKGMLKIEDGNKNLYSFSGRLKLESFPRASDITEENFVMRGSTIKNIKCIYGLVVYTGLDTKILRNIKFEKKSQSSFGFIKENRNMLYNLFLSTQYFSIALYIILVLILGLSQLNKFYTIDSIINFNEKMAMEKIYNLTNNNNTYMNNSTFNPSENTTKISNTTDSINDYLGIFYNSMDLSTTSPYKEFTISILKIMVTFILILPFNWFTFILMAYYILSLYVSWDIKIIQKNKYKVEVINSDCLSDFGQVGYILADKTGTLTSRNFNIKACSIKGRIFSFEPPNSLEENILFKNKLKDLSDLEIYQELKKNSILSKYIKEFFELMCVCNTATLISKEKEKENKIQNNKNNNNNFDNSINNNNNQNNINIDNDNNDNNNNNKDNKNQEKILGASFAEDISLMKLLKLLGYNILKTNTDITEIEADNLKKTFYILGKNKFSEERQRMSVVVKKSKEDSDSILICKGYDLSIFDLINDNDDAQLKLIIEQIKRLTQIGYRFIIVCKKELNEEETLNFVTRYKSAENYIFQKDLHFEELALDYENDFELLGVLFFEEKISSDLRYTINKLNNFNINTWIVSGDIKDNVLAVARNLDMYKNNALICEFLENDDEDDLDIKMNLFLSQFFSTGEDNQNYSNLDSIDSNHNFLKTKAKGKEFTILIHGECFSLICNDMRLYQCFTSLLSYTTKLFAYKFSPYNKYLLCKTVKMYLTKPSNSRVLAVGDGVNDFMMLKEADLSVGIRSKEILQVKNTCDVIVSKFSQITDLILVHGTWNYDRISKILFFSSYSNVLIIFPFFLYHGNFIKGSAILELNFVKLILDIIIINIMIILVFCHNNNIDRALIGLNPNIYFENFQKKKMIITKYIKVIMMAFVDASIIYYMSSLLISPSMNILGQNTDSSILAMSINFICYSLIMMKLILLNLSIMNSFILIIFLLIVGILFGLTYINEDSVITVYQSLSYFGNIFSMICIISICFFHEGFVMYYHIFFNPDFIQTIRNRFNVYIKGKNFINLS
jgi:magnesium-transporting ATPase (P-type)